MKTETLVFRTTYVTEALKEATQWLDARVIQSNAEPIVVSIAGQRAFDIDGVDKFRLAITYVVD
jgi:hypothetical protein